MICQNFSLKFLTSWVRISDSQSSPRILLQTIVHLVCRFCLLTSASVCRVREDKTDERKNHSEGTKDKSGIKSTQSHTRQQSHSTILLEYCRQNHTELEKYLESHTLNDRRQPYVSSKYLPSMFKHEHPELYRKALKRLAVGDEEMDTLVSYLCQTFPDLLVGTSHVYGYVQRLEDLVDFILCQCQCEQMDCGKTEEFE